MQISDSFYENSRKAAVWLLRVESLILVGIVIYLLLASVFSTATWPSALVGEIVFALMGATGLYFASGICSEAFVWKSTRSACECDCSWGFVLHDYRWIVSSWNSTCFTWINNFYRSTFWLSRIKNLANYQGMTSWSSQNNPV